MSADVVLTFLLQKLIDSCIEHKNLKDDAKSQLQLLKDDLSELQSLLKEAATKPEKSDIFKKQVTEMRKLVYEIEDALEICSTKTAAAKTENFFGRICRYISTDMEQKVKLLREQKVGPFIKKMYQKFEIISKHGSNSSFGKQLPDTQETRSDQNRPSEHQQNKIVDFQDESTIIGYLMDSKEELDVIAITGIAGLGKTTFASKIFQHKDIIAKFPLRIWIYVSVEFDVLDAFRRILKEINIKDVKNMSKKDLKVAVRKSLKKKEFLLVMDDVWTKQDWEKIKEILPMENGKGKVLVTTRSKNVAADVNIYREPHELKELGTDKSLELLILRVFKKLEDCPEDLKKIGQEIVERYGGVPMTILVVGGILRNIFSFGRGIGDIKEEWLKVLKNVELLEKDDDKLISNTLELSYKKLDHDLRACFLYTGLFPEKHVIPASTLKQLWIAEGFIQRKEPQSLEDTAEENLNKLINMNLVMVAKKNHNQVKACRVHDMIREFCRSKADEEDLFKVIKNPIRESTPIPRRLCFDPHPLINPSGLCFDPHHPTLLEGSRVRSFLSFYKESVDQGRANISTFPVVPRSIRVLNCRSVKFERFPEVKKLILLKHITLFIENLDSLPEEISRLVNLQTLIIDTNLGSIKVKANIWKMIKLMRLKTKAAISLAGKNWRGKSCGEIQTISRLSPESCKPALSERAPNLKALGVRGKLANLVQTMALEAFENLEKLKLMNDLDDKSELASNPLVIEKLDCFPPKLKSLTLSRTYLNWHDHMPLLANVKTLEVLKLKDNAFTGLDWLADVSSVFEKLLFLFIEDSGLVIWQASKTQFPKLRSLVIKNCQQLREIPEMPTSLQCLEIERVNKSAVESARRIALKQTEEYKKTLSWENTFKLTVGPGCDQTLFSGTIDATSERA